MLLGFALMTSVLGSPANPVCPSDLADECTTSQNRPAPVIFRAQVMDANLAEFVSVMTAEGYGQFYEAGCLTYQLYQQHLDGMTLLEWNETWSDEEATIIHKKFNWYKAYVRFRQNGGILKQDMLIDGEWHLKGRWNGSQWLWMDQLEGYPANLTGIISPHRFGDGVLVVEFEKIVEQDVFSGSFFDYAGGAFHFKNSSGTHLTPFQTEANEILSKGGTKYTCDRVVLKSSEAVVTCH